MASQEVGHSTWFRSCIPIISVKLFVCGIDFLKVLVEALGRVSDFLCAEAWFTSNPRIGWGKPRLVG